MYINDVQILYYIIIIILGIIVGYFVNWSNTRFPDEKKVFTKEFFEKDKKMDKNPWIMVSVTIIYVVLLYIFGIQNTFEKNINLIKYLILTPMLISAMVIDYRLQIIPNRLNLTLFEVGLVVTFIAGMHNVNIAVDMLLGMLAGGGIFLIITLLGGFIAGKEAMGFGDVKLMGALGLYFGLYGIIAVSVLSFLIGAIISIYLLISKKKKTDEYIPFGPFIVIASYIVMLVPFQTILGILLKIFTLGMYVG